MDGFIYALCSAAALLCAWFLFRGYGKSGYRLLFWSGLCFAGLTVNNLLVILDKIMLPEMDLIPLRLGVALVSVGLLLYGMIWDAQ